MTNKELAPLAHNNREAIIETKQTIGVSFLRLAKLLKDNKDQQLWKALGHESLEEFIADPDISFSRSKVYGLIETYERYVQKLNIPEERLSAIGSRRLLLIAPVVESDPERWLGAARNMSRSDLIEEVRAARGLPQNIKRIPPQNAQPSSPAPLSYIQHVEQSPCCVCGRTPIDRAHFPQTKVRGDDWKIIPLCRFCHTAQHDGGMKFLWDNRVKLFEYFWNIIKKHFINE